ncbi:MAG: MBL fold metallo-hydrolase [bacterium]
MTDITVQILGCRGSYPVAGLEHGKYGGATSCVKVTVGDRTIILDAGSGITAYGSELNQVRDPRVDVFVTHAHYDHILGFPYFSAMYRPDATVNIWGPRNPRYASFEATLDDIIRPPFHPVPLYEMLSRKTIRDIGEADVVYFLHGQNAPVQAQPRHPDDRENLPRPEDVAFSVHCMRGYNHPKSGVNLYKVVCGDKSVVYATDTEGYVHGDRRLVMFAQDANVLIHDAMYTEDRYTSMPVPTQGYGHSTVEIAATLAKLSNVDKLVLFHHDPSSTDTYLDEVEAFGQSLFPNTVAAADGMTLRF